MDKILMSDMDNNFMELPNGEGVENGSIVIWSIGNPTEDQPFINNSKSDRRKPKKPRALVYQFFEWDKEASRYQCKICGKKYAVPKSGGTGSLNNHMDRNHKTVFDNAKCAKNDNGASTSSANDTNFPVPLNSEKISNEIFRHKVIKFLICCDEPFTLTENKYFRDLIEYVSAGNEECRLFCAKTTKKLITELYAEYNVKMKETLQNNEGKISFVIDCWTSSNVYPFQGVIVRWINNDWELCSTVLDLTILQGKHDGVNIARAFWSVLQDFDLFTKILSVTTDNASNMDTLFDELERLFSELGIPFDSKNFRIRCFAHIMNLACQDMICSVGDGTKTEFSSDSESDDEEVQRKAKDLPVIAKMRKGVVGIRKSPQRRELLARQCVASDIESRVVLRDVRTRWNSTHTMMERAKQLKEPFDLTLRSIPKLRKHVLDDTDWKKIDDLLLLLEPFKEATEMLSNDHSPTVSRITSVYQSLFDHLEKFKTSDPDVTEPQSKRQKRNVISNTTSPWLSAAADRGLEKLEKYYPMTDGLVYIVNTVLDPRCKLVWYKATGWPKEWIDYSRKSITDLYKSQYKPKRGTEVETVESESTNVIKKHTFNDLFAKQMKNYQKAAADDELKAYLSEPVVDPELLIKEKTGIDGVLGWWKIHHKEYPNLAKMAKDFLAASGTGVPVERLFSSGPDIIGNKQQSMSAQTVKMRICLKSWLKNKDSFNQDILNAISHKLGVDRTDE